MARTAETAGGCVIMGRKPAHAPEPPPCITAIEAVNSHGVRWRIRVGKKRVATLSSHDAADLGLYVGLHWSEELAEHVARTERRAKARSKAMTMLNRRACTHGEVVAGLRKASFDTDIAHAVADELVEHGLIDEVELAVHAARALVRRTVSHEAIVQKLRARHIDARVAEDATATALAEVDHVARASRLIRQKLAGNTSAPTQRDVRRILGALARKGFEQDDIATAFREHGLDLDRLENEYRE